jgi:hypothetical protein
MLVLAALALACSGGSGAGADDAGRDAARAETLDFGGEAPGDVTHDDAVGVPETAPEADAAPVDVTPEAAPDAASDPGASDPGPLPDAGVDASPDAAPDVTPDTTPDVTPDTTPDALPDTTPDVPPDAATDTPAEVTPPDVGPWTQCTTDAECQAVLGDAGYCNLAFPGGQCQGCDPSDFLACQGLAHEGVTLTCREMAPTVCLFDCPCPGWLRCLDSEQLCVLKTCSTDAECAPFPCRPISDGGTSYCLPPL